MTAAHLKSTFLRWASRPEFWLALLFVWATASACRSLSTPWRQAALTEWLRWSLGIGLAVSLGNLLVRTRQFARGVTLAAGGVALSGFGAGLSGAGIMAGQFQDHQLFGSALLLGLPVALAVGLTARDLRWRWCARTIFLLSLACLVLSQSRSAWAGASVGLCVFGALWLRMSKRQGTRYALKPVLLTAGIAVAFLLIAGSTQMQTPLALRVQSLGALGRDLSWQTRGQTWQGARRMATLAPSAGWGLGRYPGAQQAFTHQGRMLTPAQRPSLSEEAHSLYWQTLVEMGWPGLVFYIVALLMLAGRCIYVLRQSWGFAPGSREGLAVATLSLLTSQATDAVASPSWQFGEISLPFWVLLGLGMAALGRMEMPERDAVPFPRPARMALAGAVILLLAAPVLPHALLSPVEAYVRVTGVQLTSVTITPSRSSLHMGGSARTITLTAIGHYRFLQTGLPAPDRVLTFDGPPDGITGTLFLVRCSFPPDLDTDTHGRTGFHSLDPCERNLLTLDAREALPQGGVVTLWAKCSVADSLGSHMCVSSPVTVRCFP